MPAPPIDPRSAHDIEVQVRDLISVYAPSWRDFDAAGHTRSGASAALIGVFARFVQIIIERLNQVPEKNLLAFLDLLGAAPLPPQSARVPLTFFLAAGSSVDAVIPAGTQVAAPAGNGAAAPVVFETEAPLVVTSAALEVALTRDPSIDRYARRSGLLSGPDSNPVLVFEGDTPIDHCLYIAQDALFAIRTLDELKLSIVLSQDSAGLDLRQLEWGIWDGENSRALSVASDSTDNLSRSGEVVFDRPGSIPLVSVDGRVGRWLRCRLLTPINPASEQRDGMVRVGHLPTISALTLEARQEGRDLTADALLFNAQLIDQDQAFLPFGAQPKFGDTFYVACGLAMSLAPSTVSIRVVLVNPSGGNHPSVPDATEFGIELLWELWDAVSWRALEPVVDTTQKLTTSGVVSFNLPVMGGVRTIGAVHSCWIRVRIVGGNYGEEGRIDIVNPPTGAAEDTPQQLIAVAPTFKPPLISALRLDLITLLADLLPDSMITYNDFQYRSAEEAPIAPFTATHDADPALYLGFGLPRGRARFPNVGVSIYCLAPALVFGQAPDNSAPVLPPQLVWEYWNGGSWEHLTVADHTAALTHSGLVEWLSPADFSPGTEFGLVGRYWIRVRWSGGGYRHLPRLVRIQLNTVMASHSSTWVCEMLGASDGSKSQTFRASQTPLLVGQRLEVGESVRPGQTGRAGLAQGLEVTGESAGTAWVAWQEVGDFHGSGPLDRHYRLDHLSGEVRFGDGINGMIPPLGGAANIRLAHYRSGGGKVGNQPAGSITQLQTTIPSVDRVVNLVSANGGADAQTLADFMERAPRASRHLGYAVTQEDYEDLALMASPEVTRSKCVPLLDLGNDPDGMVSKAGTVSLIIVPRTSVSRPSPSQQLIDDVSGFLHGRRSPLVDLVVVGPEYIRVEIEAELAVESLASAATLEAGVQQALERFLHPLTGGPDGNGWRFGRKPHRSDVYTVLEAASGVDHVRSLNVLEREDRRGVANTGRFLVYSGLHRISLSVVDQLRR